MLQAFVFLLGVLVLPLGLALIFKIKPSRKLLSKAIIRNNLFRMDRFILNQAETEGIYKFHRVDDEFIIFSKPKMKRKLIKTLVIWMVITIVAFNGLYDPKTVEILGVPVAALLITLLIFFRFILPAPKLIFDRLNNKVVFKGNFVNPRFSASFDAIDPALLYDDLLAVSHPIFSYSVLAFGEFKQDTWSFYVQYMDRNRPLPVGDVFDDYREKDYLRRKKDGYHSSLYPSSSYICEANSGFVNGTPEFKKQFSAFTLKIEDAHQRVIKYIEKDGNRLVDIDKLRFTGLYKDNMVFQYQSEPKYDDLKVYKSEDELKGCYLIHKKNMTIKVVS